MKEITKERIQKFYDSIFVADDGTEFTSKEECLKYESSARGVLFAKYNQFVINSTDAYSFFGFGSDEEILDIVRIDSQEKIDVIMQILLIEQEYFYTEQDGDSEERIKEKKEHLSKLVSRLKKSLVEKDIIFIGRGYDCDSFWFAGTRNEKVSSMLNIGKEEEEKSGKVEEESSDK